MKYYQLNILISPRLDQTQIDSFLGSITSLLKDKGEISIGRTKRINLAYPIKKETQCWLLNIDFSPKSEDKEWISGIKTELNKNQQILRYNIIKRGEKKKSLKENLSKKKKKLK